MTLTFKHDIDKKEYMDFLATLGHYNVTQTPMWAEVKADWGHTLCGLYEEGKPVACALLLIRKLAPSLKIIYSPRGFLIDYNNKAHLKAFVEGIQSYASKIGAYLVRIDPEIMLSSKHKDELTEYEAGASALANLQAEGFIHMGFSRDLYTYTQPRFNAEYKLTDEKGAPLPDEVILSGFDKKLKKFIGRYTADRGIYFEAKTGEEYAEEFYKISAHTEQRQHVLLRNLSYFKKMAQAFGEDCIFFFAKMNLGGFIAFTEEQIKKDINKEQAIVDLAQAKQLRTTNETVTLSALLTIKSKDTGYLEYSGFDDSLFPRFRTTNQLRYEAMRYFRDHGCKIFSFVGLDGDLSDTISQFKMKFNPHIVEFAGEFELPVKKGKYKVMTKVFPVLKKIYITIMMKLKR